MDDAGRSGKPLSGLNDCLDTVKRQHLSGKMAKIRREYCYDKNNVTLRPVTQEEMDDQDRWAKTPATPQQRACYQRCSKMTRTAAQQNACAARCNE